MTRHALRQAALVIALIVAATRPASATTVRSMSWQELALDADIVAEVECTVAGGIVAKYRVVTIWKGKEKPGDEIRIEISPDTWEPQFPLALVGQRFIVAGYHKTPVIVMSATMGSGVPLWFRQLDSDYKTPLFQGMEPVPPGHEKAQLPIFGTAFENLDAFGKSVQALETEPAEVKDKLRFNSSYSMLAADSNEKRKAAWKMVVACRTLADAQRALDTIGSVEAEPLRKIIQSYQEEQQAATRPRAAPALRPVPAPPSEAEIQAAIKTLSADGALRDDKSARAFELLTKTRPSAAFDYLIAWQNPQKDWSDAFRGYELGSYVSYVCPAEGRKSLLKRLTEAKDPEVRVAAAVYWAFDDAPAATAQLKEFSKLEGDPGAWAAITLARRGEATAMPRAMEIFNTPGNGSMAGVPHRNFQKQMLVLLSNSAAASGVEQPPHEANVGLENGHYPGMDEWYAKNAGKLKLVDAWADELAKKRAD